MSFGSRTLEARLSWPVVVSLGLSTFLGLSGMGQKRKNEEPKSQVQPLPPQPPMALKADTESLDFHLSPLLKTGGLAAQIRTSLNELIRDTKGETIVKLRAFVAGAGDARRVQAEMAQIFTDHKLPLPVLSVLQVGALGEEAAKVVIEAVVATRRSANPNGLAFFAGRSGATLPETLGHLQNSMRAANITGDRMLAATCFLPLLENPIGVRSELQAAFPHAQLNLVQPLRDAVGGATICQAVGQLTQQLPGGPVVLLTEHRVVLVNARQLVWTGLQLSFGSFLDDAQEAFTRLQRSAANLDPLEAPVEVNVFSVDPSGGAALSKTSAVPPSTLAVHTVEGLPSIDATAGLEAVMAPGVQASTLRP